MMLASTIPPKYDCEIFNEVSAIKNSQQEIFEEKDPEK
jgi:hypothetical protein